MFELEYYAGTNDWHVVQFGLGGRKTLGAICKAFDWNIAQFVETMKDVYKAELTYMRTTNSPWIYFRWKEENKSQALKFARDLNKNILLRRLGK